MLTSFSVTSYRGFKDTVTLDLCHPRDYSFNSEYIEKGVIRNSLLIGPNASGKTNILRAIADVRSNYFPADNHSRHGHTIGFINADSTGQTAKFEYHFSFNEVDVAYTYTKNSSQRIERERLCFDNACVFDYSPKEGLLDSNLALIGADHLNWTFVGDYSSAVAYITSNAPVPKGSILERLRTFTSRITMAAHEGWGSSKDIGRYLDDIMQRDMVASLESFLHEMGIDEHLVVLKDPDGREAVYCSHAIPLSFAHCMSSGTRTLVSLYYLYQFLNPGTLYLLDEFDAYCHFELAETLVRYLGTKPGVQTIATTHNTSLTRNGVMRPDCIFKFGDDGSLKALSELTSRELRFGNNIERLLRNGEFG